MKRLVSVPCLFLALVLALSLLGCGKLAIPDGGGTAGTSDLGPAAVPVDTATASTLPARVAAGVDWLWASYTALKAKVDPTIEPMKKLYVTAQEMIVAVQAHDWLKALALYGEARELVGDIAKGVGK